MSRGGKILKSDILDPGVKGGIEELTASINTAVASFKKLKAEAKAINKEIKSAKGFEDVSRGAKKAGDNVTKLSAAEKKLQRATQDLAFQLSKEGKELAVLNEKKRQAALQNRRYAQSQVTAVKSTNTFSKAIGSFAFKFNALGNIVANVASTVTRFARQALRAGIKQVVDFDQAMADVSAISQATDEQFQALRDSAMELGRSTKFTQTQVAGLQKEYAKLGFTSSQIITLQEATLQLATATGAELGPAALVVGGAMRAYGLEMQDASRVAATLAVATTKSALAFSDYETILSTLGPVARSFGFSLEDTIGLMGELRNANFDTSSAATATRNILLNLADSNGALAKALGGNVTNLEGLVAGLVTLDEQGVDLNRTLELTDKRSVAAFNTFLKGAENALTLRDAVTDVNGELDIMVTKQLSTLENKTKLLISAWEGFIQSQVDSTQVVNNTKLGIDLLSGSLNTLAQNPKAVQIGFELMTAPITLVIKQTQLFYRLIGKLTKAQKEEIEVIEDKTDALGEMEMRLLKVNEAEGAQLKNAQNAEEIEKQRKKAEEDRLKGIKDKFTKLREVRAYEEASQKAIDGVYKDSQVTFEELTNEQIKNSEDVIDQMLLEDESFINIEEGKTKTLAEQIEERRRQKEKDAERDIALAEFTEQKIKDIKQQLGNEVFNALVELNNRAIEKADYKANEELRILDEQYRNELITKEQYERLKIESERKAQEESLKLRRRAAVIDKAQALFNIALNTAKGILEYGSNPLTAVLVPYIIGLGAAQAAVVAATPIPQFAEGTDSSPEGPAIVGEEGRELMVDPSGNMSLTPGKSTLMDLDKGTKIIPSDITQSLLGEAAMLTGLTNSGNDKLLQESNRLLKQLVKKPVSSSTLTPAGILTSVHSGSSVIKKMDRYFK